MSNLIMLPVILAGFFILDFVESEEFTEEFGDTSGNYRTAYSDLPRKGSDDTYHNHEDYPSLQHHHGYSGPHFNYPHLSYPLPDSWSNSRNNPYFDSLGPRQFPPGFQHNPEYHSRHPVSNDDNERVGKKNDPPVDVPLVNATKNEIPLDLLKKFDMYEVNDILNDYVDGIEDDDQAPSFSSRFGGQEQERNAAVLATKAGCTPERTTISLVNSDDPTIVYIPKCTKIDRCSGCCSSNLLECQAVEKEIISVQVYKTKYTGEKKLKFVEKEIIPIERHINCKCDCKVKAEHCHSLQVYMKSKCACVCSNTDEEKKCYKNPEKKEWDSSACTCNCRGVTKCSTNSVYDHHECRCKVKPSRRHALNEKEINRADKLTTQNLEV